MKYAAWRITIGADPNAIHIVRLEAGASCEAADSAASSTRPMVRPPATIIAATTNAK